MGHLAYLIYTSGTTGRPKAVMVEHAQLAHTLRAVRLAFGFAPGDRMPCLAAFSFDIFLFELLGPLLAGGTAVLYDLRPAPDVPRLAADLPEMTLFHAVPALMRQVVEELARQGSRPERLRRVFVGGDAVPGDLLAAMRQTFPAARITVIYGPTEAAIVAALHEVTGNEPASRLLVGRPLPDVTLELRDRYGNLVPVGVPGEIWLGGPGVTRGYLHRPELTAAVFAARDRRRVYRTGDLGRRGRDGTVEFLGRIDQQVKVRGFRVELGEIEAALAALPGVRQAVVLVRAWGSDGSDRSDGSVRSPGDRRLVAYLAGDVGHIAVEELSRSLRERLPDYMVPAAWVVLEALPLTPHGKVDRRALAACDIAEQEPETTGAPRTPAEELLAGIWAELLGRGRIGLHDDFFAAGGHSLLATRVISRLRDAFGVDLPLRALFEAPTVAALAARVEAALAEGRGLQTPPILPVGREGDLPLSFSQERFWIFDQLEPGSPLYIIAGSLRLTGVPVVPALEEAFNEIVRRHEALRTTFAAREGRPVQRIRPRLRVPLPILDLTALPAGVREAEILRIVHAEKSQPFDLARGPHLRLGLLRLEGASWILLFSFHHIVSDAWSSGVLVRELAALYGAFSRGLPSPLPELPVQYADFAVWQRQWLAGDVLAEQIGYWTEALAGAPTLVELPSDRPRLPGGSLRAAVRRLALPDELAAGLQALARRGGATLFMTLLAAFEALLFRHTGQQDLLVGTPIANRNRAETEGLIGCFINTLVLRGRLEEDGLSFRELLERAKATTLEAYVHQDLPLEKVVEALQVERAATHNPLFQVMFALQNAPLGELVLPGLTLAPFETGSEMRTPLDLSLGLTDVDGGLWGGCSYRLDLFDEATVDRLLERFQALLAAVAGDPGLPLVELPDWRQERRAQILAAVQPAAVEGPEEAARARLAAREERLADQRSALSDKKKAALARLLRGKSGAAEAATPAAPTFSRRPDPSRAVLSFAQERLWFLDRLEPGTALYNIAIPLRLTGRLDLEAARRSLGELVRRHEVLRTTFAEEAGGAWQLIGPAIPPLLPVVDLRTLPAAAREPELRRQIREECLRPFDLERGPLLRALLLRLDDAAWAGVFNLHHIVSDAWSSGILVREFGALYAAFAGGRRPVLPELPAQYGDFAHWQRQWLSGEVLAAQLAYWRRELADAPPLLELTTDRPRPSRPGSEVATESLELSVPLAVSLRTLSLAANATLFMTLLASFQALLHRYTGQDDLLVGSPIANRTQPETQELIGFFVNTLVLRGRCDTGSFQRLLDRTRETALGAYAHQDLPFARLVEALQVERDLSHNPLFQVVFSLLAGETGGSFRLPGLEIVSVEPQDAFAKFDLSLAAEDAGDRLRVSLDYRADLFEAATMRRMLGHLGVLLEAVVADPGQPVSELPLLTATERRQLAGWRGSLPETPAEIPVLHLFEEQARRSPAAPAVVFGEESLTYAELDRRAGRLARRLSSLGVAPEDRVGLLLDRSLDVAVGILGVWKAGAAYVPLDPTQPDARLEYLLEDAFKEQGTPVLVAHAGLRDKLAHLPHGDGTRVARVVWLGAEETEPGDEGTAAALPAGPGPRSLAYLIYTSGTTGKPKAVMVEHGQLAHTLWSAQQAFGFRPGDRMPCLAPFSFDIFLFELLGPLLAGGTVVLFGLKPSLDLGRLVGELPGMTLLHAVPALMRQIVEELERRGVQPPLRRTFVGGDVVPAEVVARMRAAFPAAVTMVLYGPTEGTIIAAGQEATGEESRALLGRPLPGVLLELRDRWGGASPAGVPGEVWIGGPGVTRGYLHRPELTAERFTPGPDGRWYRRWYRTGDLARWLPDGVLEFLGRIDHQVKVRGFRIELGEIEAVLAALPGVREAVVLAHEARSGRSDQSVGSSGDRWLVAYVAGDAGELAVEELRRSLGERLPDYMVPAAWVLLDTLPLTSHGKVDRAALARLATEAGGDGEGSYVAPRTPVEELLSGIWAELLNRERVGADDEFFSLGGHSLLATRLVVRVESALGVDLPLRAVFEAPTVAGLAQRIEALLAGDAGAVGAEAPPIRPVPRPEREETGLPLSFAQERLWFLDRLEPGGAVYNMPAALGLYGVLDVAALERALREMVRRHESLRTTFIEAGGAARQRIHPPASAALPWVDLSGLSAERREEEARRLAAAEAARPFDLERGPLLRAGLLRLAAEEWVLLLTLHHIVSDGWSMGVLVAEAAALYAAFAQGLASPLPELPVQYADFAVWQRQWLSGAVLESQLAYWRGELEGAPAVLELPTDRPRPPVRTGSGAGAVLDLPAEVAAAVAALGRRQGATLFMIALAALQALLWRLTDQPDLAVGTVVANRTRPEIEGLIGFFVNTLVMRGRLDRIGDGAPTFEGLLAAARAASLGAYAHQDLPFERLVEELKVERSLAFSPLFQVLLVVQNAPLEELDLPGLRLEPLGADGAESATAKFDLSLTLGEAQGRMTAALEHSTDIFDTVTAQRLLEQWVGLLAAAVVDPGRRVAELPLLTAAQRFQLLVEWNEAGGDALQTGLCLHELFAAQVRRTPEAEALIASGQRLRYGELAERSRRLAAALRGLGVGPEVRVGVCLPRTADLVAALLGVLEAGGAYVPLDPAYPRDRLAFMLEDSGARVLVTSREAAANLPGFSGAWLWIDLWVDGGLPEAEAEPTGPAALPDNLAYLIYTSGSTGRPKGVAIEHRSAAALVDWSRRVFSAEDLAGVLAATSVCFDLSVFEIFVTLSRGGRVILAENALALPGLASADEVTLINTVPSAMAELVRNGLPSSVRVVNLAGEPIPPSLARAIHELGRPRLYDLYGPSEDTTYSTWALLAPGMDVTIGRPLAGTRAFVLDRRGEPLPAGVPGELYLTGAGLARGYLGRPELTAERFVPAPFADLTAEPGARAYRTGDLVRFRRDGNLDFLGRLDHQVKVRGFRVELGEIEALLESHPAVRDAAVVVADEGSWKSDRSDRSDRSVGSPGDRRLIACVVPAEEAPPAEELRAWLRERLPQPVVPGAFVFLSALPLTPNGKVDRRALAALSPDAGESAAAAAAPRTPTEEIVARIWEDLLGRERIGAADDFFALGGHSLLGTRLVSRLRDAFGVELPLRRLFEAPTVRALSAAVETAVAARQETIPAPPLVPCAGELPPLSFAQERLWVLDRLEPGSAAYNLATALRLSGHLDVPALAASLAEIVRRHAALRTTFAEVMGEPRQIIAPPSGLPLPLVDLAALPGADRESAAARLVHEDALRPFDLARGPLVRALLLRLESREHGLLLNTHHIVSDGWSQGVLVHESAALYEAFHERRPLSVPALPELPVQYTDFAVWQRRWLAGEVLEAQLAYWREALAGAPAVLELPTDRPRPPVQTFRGAIEPLVLSEELTAALRELGRREGVTLFMALLAGFQALLYRLSGQDDVLVGSPVANRNRSETEGLIGFFVNTLVLRTRFDSSRPGGLDVRALLGRARTAALDAYAHQDLPFERLVEERQIERSLAHGPLFQVMLALQNAPLGRLELPGLLLAPMDTGGGTAKFDLNLAFGEGESRGPLAGSLEYNTDLFDAATARRLLDHFQVLLAAAVAEPESRVSDLPLLREGERHQLLVEWNDTGAPPAAPLLHEAVRQTAERVPDAVAVAMDGVALTYGALERLAGRLARELRRRGVKAESRVGISMERSPEMVAALLAVLAAGGAYVALDPAYPRERLAWLVEDAVPLLVITSSRRPGALPFLAEERILQLDRDWPETMEALPAVLPEQPAYLIYTSGSTGRPKGVAIPHGAAAALLGWAARVFTAAELAGVLASTSINFDLSVFELFLPLSQGGTVVLAQNALELPALAEAARVTLVNTVPSAMRELAGRGLPPSVTAVSLAGEPLARALVEQIYAAGTAGTVCRIARVCNLYGPTEDTTYSTFAWIPRGEEREPAIGRAIAGTWASVLDRGLAPVPAGVAGELYLGGAGLARGYLNRPDLTAERFVPDPLAALRGAAGGRLYRTGDRVRWSPAGELQYLGRTDHQVKVRGFRVEPGEIEAVLARHEGVRETVVVARPDAAGTLALVAYLVGEGGAAPEPRELRAWLARQLPAPMIPAAFVGLEALPLTPNGKVDRKALPAPIHKGAQEGAGAQGPNARNAPLTPTAALLAGIWESLLGVDKVTAGDDFFALGGHSLLGTRLVSRLRVAFGVELPLRVLFEAPRLADLAARIDTARQGAVSAPHVVAFAEELPPLSFAQERLWFLDRLEPGSAAYNLPTALRLSGGLDVAALAASLDEIVRRHAVLRTTFAEVAGKPRQIVAPPAGLPLPLVDLAALPGAAREAEAARLVHADTLRPFDIARGPLARALLLRLEGREHGLLLNTHHIVSDGWSQGVLVRESAALYEAYHERRPLSVPALPELPIQYTDFAVWQRRWLTGEVLEAQLAYWREALAGAPAVLELPTDRPRPPVQTFRGAVEPVALAEELTAALRELGRREGVTLFMALLAGFQALLHRLSGQDDVLVGSPVANRNRSETEGLIGFFVNTLVLRARFGSPESSEQGGLDVGALLGRARTATLDAYDHQDLPFERLVEELRIERSLAHGPLFQVMLALQNVSVERLELPGLLFAPMSTGGGTAKFDLTLSLGESGGPLVGSLEYNTHLFDAATARRLTGQLAVLLAAAAADPSRRVRELPLLTAAERFQLLVEWNDATPHPLGEGPLVHERVAAQARQNARQNPHAEAVVSPAGRLTYGELAARANRLAWHLRSLGVGPEVRVAVCMGWTVERVVAVLAVLQAGGAYVTLDPAYPPERLAWLIADSRAPVVLTEERYGVHLPVIRNTAVLRVDADWQAVMGREDLPPESGAGPQNLAYVVYTSGSTGEPKGVEVPHAGLLNLVLWHHERYAVRPADRAGQVSSPAFDASVWDLWPYLTAGAAVHFPDEETRLSPTAMVRWWAEEGITLIFLPTPLAEAVMEEAVPPESGLALRALLVGGDRLHHAPGPEWPFRLVNHYGPAECSVVSTATEVPAEPWGSRGGMPPGLPPIGRGIDGVRLYVLDAWGELVPPGVPGELYIGGAGLARGYLGRPELTAAAFVPSPFAEPGARMYRTGDRVRWLAGGVLDFLGRFDHQVKVRGIRIELGEIEAVLTRHPAVREAAVVMADGRLVAYGAGDAGILAVEELREWLGQRLPDAMVPAAFLFLDALPLTPNGKVDRRALAALAFAAETGTEVAFAAPRTPTEEIIAGIWAGLLGRERVGSGDDFFALGGHSLLATRVVSMVRDAFGVELPLRRLFDAPTVKALAAAVDAVRGEAGGLLVPPLTAGFRGDRPRLSFAQERLWFLEHLDPGGAAYSASLALRLHGHLDPALFSPILTEVVRRHEVLRTTFAHAGGEPYQIIGPPFGVPVPVVDLRGLSEAEQDEEVARRARGEAARPFDLAKGPLLRALLLHCGEENWVALLNLHHIVCDGWSMGILLREFAALYEAFAQPFEGGRHEARPSPLPELEIQYADYAVWQRRWLTGEALEAQLAYWRDELAGAPALLELPTDRPRPPVQTFRGAGEAVVLTAELTAALQELGRRFGVTLFMVLLAGFQALLHRLSGQDDVLVGSPVANRNRSETEGLIGFFVNTLVLRTRFATRKTAEPAGLEVRTLLERVRTAALNAYAHQDLPFERLVEELQIERSLAHGPLFQVLLVLQNTPVGRLELPGLLLTPMDADGGTAKFDLSLSFGEIGGHLAGGLEYNTDLFDAATARRIAGQLTVLLAAAADLSGGPGRHVGELPLLSAAERSQLLVEWNDTASGYPRDLTLAELFAEQVAHRPDAVALVAGIAGLEQVTYGELNRRARALSRRLAGLGTGPEVPVALFAQRSPAAVAGLLAVTMAGGFYVPLDPDHPAERLTLLLDDVGASLLLVDRESIDRLPFTSARPVLLDGEDGGEWEKAAPKLCLPENLAYVMYTSGSTGRPKGVGVTHRNVNRLVRGGRFADLGAGQVFLQLAPLAFDASTLEVWGALANGGRLVLAPPGRLSLTELAETLTRHEVTTLWLTAGLFHQMVDEASDGLRHVRQLLAGGDVLSPPHVRRALAALGDGGDGVVINGYGPTENTTFTCCHSMRREDDAAGGPGGPGGAGGWSGPVPIGKPIADTRIYLLDFAWQPVPAGVHGELFAGGDGMARGYFGRPDLTAERFVPDPLGASPGDRLYRTGDLARWRPNGVVEFLGRRDHQVKLRGFRVEPGEIEAVLAGHPEVRQAAVLVGRDAVGGKRLEGYVAGSVEATALRHYLERLLPPYMVPSVLVVLETLPLTPNGKVDRRALSRVETAELGTAGAGGEEGGEPRDVLELQLARIWREVLGVARLGIREDFFAAGGHSLLALSLMARIREQLGRDLPLAALFQAPTIESMAALLRRREGEGAPAVSCLVPIQAGGPSMRHRRPFFCVHPGGGDVLCYALLARYLGPDRPFYGLQSRGLSGEAEPLRRIEDMAALYLEELRRVQPAGPYRLGGWSLGGIVAFEMAHQLREQGETVALLALLDCPPELGGEPEDDLTLLRDVVAYIENLWGRDLGLGPDELESLAPEERLPLVMEKLREADFLPPGTGPEQLVRVLDVYRNNTRAARAYVAKPWPERVVLFRAGEVPEGAPAADPSPEPDLGWSRVAAGIDLHAVPGTHLTMVAEPHVQELARQLGRCLEEAEEGVEKALSVT